MYFSFDMLSSRADRDVGETQKQTKHNVKRVKRLRQTGTTAGGSYAPLTSVTLHAIARKIHDVEVQTKRHQNGL